MNSNTLHLRLNLRNDGKRDDRGILGADAEANWRVKPRKALYQGQVKLLRDRSEDAFGAMQRTQYAEILQRLW